MFLFVHDVIKKHMGLMDINAHTRGPLCALFQNILCI